MCTALFTLWPAPCVSRYLKRRGAGDGRRVGIFDWLNQVFSVTWKIFHSIKSRTHLYLSLSTFLIMLIYAIDSILINKVLSMLKLFFFFVKKYVYFIIVGFFILSFFCDVILQDTKWVVLFCKDI